MQVGRCAAAEYSVSALRDAVYLPKMSWYLLAQQRRSRPPITTLRPYQILNNYAIDWCYRTGFVRLEGL